MADLSPIRGDSKASRHAMYCIPVDCYAFGPGHVNLTLQNVLAAVVSDLNGLAREGLQTDYGVSGLG